MKLIRSIPGVPSATPAHENRASNVPSHAVDRGVDRGPLGEVDLDRGHPGPGDRGEVHHDHLGAGGLHHLGGGGTHTGRTTDDEDALAVVSEDIEGTHVDLLSCQWGLHVRVRRRRR